jgi:hypothetical protein
MADQPLAGLFSSTRGKIISALVIIALAGKE